MRIWYLSAYDQPKGQSSRTYDFALELVKLGHDVTIFTNSYCHFTHVEKLTSGERWRLEDVEGIKVVWMKTIAYEGNGFWRAMNMLSNVWRIFESSRKMPESPDVVIGPSVPLLTGWAALALARFKRAAFVFEVRDVWPQALVDLGNLRKGSFPYLVLRFIEKYLYSKADRISAVLPYTWKHVELSGADPGKVKWIPNGANLERFVEIDRLRYSDDSSIVMYVGGFSATHDIATVLKVAKIFQEENNHNTRFVVVGSGKSKSDCLREASLLGLSNVEFRDTVPKSKVPELQAEADILIACVKDTPVYQFGINSNKLYDYLASAKPIVFSGAVPNDPVAESGAGFTVRPESPEEMAEAIKKILQLSPQERVRMGQLGRAYAESEFDVRRLALRMESLLKSAIGDGSRYGT